jgi:hypothetical protein
MAQLQYATGEDVELGDVVEVDGRIGRVVANLGDDQYAPDYSRSEWSYLETGILWESPVLGLVHLPSIDDDAVFKGRASQIERERTKDS